MDCEAISVIKWAEDFCALDANFIFSFQSVINHSSRARTLHTNTHILNSHLRIRRIEIIV